MSIGLGISLHLGRGGAVAAAFAPTDLSGLRAWWNADNITGVADGAAVASWPELVGSHTAAQASGTKQPLYDIDGINGKPAVLFDDVNDCLTTAAIDLTNTSGATVFVVAHYGAAADYNVAFETTADATANAGSLLVYKDGVANRIRVATRGNVGNSIFENTVATANGPTPVLVSATFDLTVSASEVQAWRNGLKAGSMITDSNNAAGTLANAVANLGSRNNGASLTQNGRTRHILLYDRVLTGDERRQVERWINLDCNLVTANAVVVFDGDSLTFGTGSTGGNTYPAQTVALLTPTITTANYGVAGQRVDQMASDAATQVDANVNGMSPANVLVMWGGVNDLVTADTADQVYAELQAYGQARQAAGWTVVVLDITPAKSAAVVTFGQAAFDAKRNAVNASIASGWSTFADAFVPLTANAAFDAPADADNTTNYDADKIHLNNTGYGIVAGLVKTALNGLGIT